MEIIDLCCEGLCMKPANASVTVHVSDGSGERSRKVGLLCARHVNVLKEHAAKRMKQDKTLKVIIDEKPLETVS